MRRKDKGTQRMDIGETALHAGHQLREGCEPAEHPLAGKERQQRAALLPRSGSLADIIPHPPLQIFADGSDSGRARQCSDSVSTVGKALREEGDESQGDTQGSQGRSQESPAQAHGGQGCVTGCRGQKALLPLSFLLAAPILPWAWCQLGFQSSQRHWAGSRPASPTRNAAACAGTPSTSPCVPARAPSVTCLRDTRPEQKC